MPEQRQIPTDKGKSEHSCCGVIEESAFQARKKRAARNKPQPWIAVKLMVFITLGIMGYTAYVYIRLLCIRMIQRKPGAGAGRGSGVALLVVFLILYLWMVCAYMKVVLTPPGFAREFIPKSSQQRLPSNFIPTISDTNISEHHDELADPSHTQAHASQRLTSTNHAPQGDDIAGPSYEYIASRPQQQLSQEGINPSRNHRYSAGELKSGNSLPVKVEEENLQTKEQYGEGSETNAGVVDALSCPTVHAATATLQSMPTAHVSGAAISGHIRQPRHKSKEELDWEIRREKSNVSRRPPQTLALHPANLYCYKDELVKPYRAHHCRMCGTCVLKYDHHCPWIGQCVGARNHKFFVNFCQAAAMLTAYVFSTLLAYTVVRVNQGGDIDPQIIIIISLAALFALFTTTLDITHVMLILKGQSTVENMNIQEMKSRERDALSRAFSWWEFRARRATIRDWNEEWGDLDREGHIWWMGSRRRCWEDVMGKSVWGWFLPIGRSQSDGTSYAVNPRFDEQGRWRRREEWPAELR